MDDTKADLELETIEELEDTIAPVLAANRNSVLLELDNSNRSALDKLQALCGEFDRISRSGRPISGPDKIFRASLADELWGPDSKDLRHD